MADTTEQQPQLVDETPISPIRPNQERRNSLEDHLKHRPDRAELVEKNILPASTAAPGLLAHQKEPHHAQLQKHMLEDKLNDKISHRPDPEALIKKDILHDDPRTTGQDEAAKKYEEAIEDEYAKREGGA
ncbi:Hypothetical protein NCS54_00042600 [Fusarium falciforme]|uniref:Hypothetical protein n=1 Tax=Fusarium falciforme TaxID=195108 RepID=UPI0022FFF15A|nr:Hypothetical protein NCS54_00042600 [Fusarium falciforme]KAI8690515.1 hypothetical protein NCS56_00042400 [Fusarium sp. Ph1]WAO83243.1 Hypothetical protein NCS54_00042600 [Fusarium falciforme]